MLEIYEGSSEIQRQVDADQHPDPVRRTRQLEVGGVVDAEQPVTSTARTLFECASWSMTPACSRSG
ncbi:MAG: hypothetical protein L0K86_16010 [Actinomycetia bacterium]|nr:hypothetical protein [Actinomycetes bacterium]